MDELLHLARRMMLRAHAPYSKFHVGAAVRAEDGSIHGGCNVENAAYPQGLCAEASAIAAMVAAGHKRLLECLVVGPGPEVITPCGGCRQWLTEFRLERVLYRRADGSVALSTPAALLPDTFRV